MSYDEPIEQEVLSTDHPQAEEVNNLIKEQRSKRVLEVINMNRENRRKFAKANKISMPPSIINLFKQPKIEEVKDGASKI